MQFAFAAVPDSPVEAMGGTARVRAERSARPALLRVRNRSNKPVEHIEVGWIVRDQQGREFFAASVPADLKLAPRQQGEITRRIRLRFQRPVAIQSVTGFVANVEFAGGSSVDSATRQGSGVARRDAPAEHLQQEGHRRPGPRIEKVRLTNLELKKFD